MNYENVSNTEFQSKAQELDAVIIDVRTPGEFEEGFIHRARNLNLMSPDFMQELEVLDKTKTYLLYCHSGSRSGTACSIMASKGFTKVYNLADGIMFWDGSVSHQFENA